ncbi:MAG: DNA translocase FtsK [Opitutaceae bacterium]|nr:DNA translocase FtsK [Opitutaceae bacterium]
MPKAESSNPKDTPSFEGPRYRPKWIAATLCFMLGVLFTVALIDFTPEQSIQHSTHPTSVNLVGVFGAEFSWWAYHLLGVSIWLLPVFLGWMTWVNLRNARRLPGTRLLAMISCMASLSALVAMQHVFFTGKSFFTAGPGGILGQLIYDDFLKDNAGVFGSGLILSLVYLLGLMFIFTRDIAAEFDRMLAGFNEWRHQRAALKAQRAENLRRQQEEQAKQRASLAATATPTAKPSPSSSIGAPPPSGLGKKFVVPQKEDPLAESAAKPATPGGSKAGAEVSPPRSLPAATPPATDIKSLAAATAAKLDLKIVTPEETKKAKVVLPTRSDDNYEFPPLALLKERDRSSSASSEEEHRQNAENLIRILTEFGVEVTLGEIHVGPVITRYEVVPAPGVRVEKISSLDKNIALGMKAQSVRILAPIPGKAAVGVEVPNQKATPVGLRDILESEDWVGMKAELPIAIGKDVSGKPLISDLTKMPHLLIAGATGSGKSVCINSIIASILYSASPKNVRLLMVDPKIVELQIFNTLPHMLIPVVTEPKKVPAALKWLLSEMEQRYQIFAKVGVRNIASFNARKRETKAEPAPSVQQPELEGVGAIDDIEIPDRLPYIVAIIDELADLMMVAPAEIETSVARLAQLTRAAGIHLIIATQRPSVNVITGIIKANLPSRIAFQVASQVDSRTILDIKGAETLIGRGDMLFNSASKLIRAQGAFVSDEEISTVVEFLKKNGPPVYASHVQAQIDRAASEDDEDGDDEDEGEEDDLGDDDELYRQAIDVLKSTRRASTSMLQRRLRIGYNRAARIMEIMEGKGIVGPENGSSPREILVDLDSL